MKHLTISTALIFMLAGIVGTAEAETSKLRCTVSGTFADGVETNIDTDGDGTSATLAQGITNCNDGRSSFLEEEEWVPSATVTTCPQGSNEYHIDDTHGQQRSVSTDGRTGDQIFSRYTSATLCINFSTVPFQFTSSGRAEYIGGTGQFKDATGSYNSQSAGTYLMYGFKNGVFGGFGQFGGTIDGSLIVPKH
jgi:hypothetical protein